LLILAPADGSIPTFGIEPSAIRDLIAGDLAFRIHLSP